MLLKVKEPFKWAHEHVRVVEYQAGDEIETDDQDLIDVATTEGWIETGEQVEAKATKARKGAPRTRLTKHEHRHAVRGQAAPAG